jgi:hypothetical protein
LYATRFIWDIDKNKANIRKHGVSFDEAKTVFLDDNALVMSDEEHSDDEERFIIMGLSTNLRLLVVCHCFRDNDKVVRLISARKAIGKERELYGGAR